MAQETNFGAEKLTSRIVEEAEAEAGRIIVEAEAKAGAISSQAEAEAERLNIEYAKKAEKAAADIIERSRTNGALDSRKTALREKRRVLDAAIAELPEDMRSAAFELAEKELCALEGEKREALLSLMIRENVKGGETLRPAKPDRARLASLIEKQNSSLPRPVELGEDIEAGGGFRLLGCGYETDCTFEAMLRDFRERRESEAARVLFE